jgi:hypothetical protein
MTDTELSDALDGFQSYDSGATDSGIHDEALRARARTTLLAMDEDTRRRFLARHVRDYFLTEDWIEQGYGVIDAIDFLEWYSRFVVDIR